MTLQELVGQFKASVDSAFNINIKSTSYLYKLCEAFSRLFIILQKYINSKSADMFPSTATNQLQNLNGLKLKPLAELGTLSGAGTQLTGTRTELTAEVIITGAESEIIVSQGTILVSPSGIEFATIEDTYISGANKNVKVKASEIGYTTGVIIGSELNFTKIISGLSPTATVTMITKAGTADETTEQYRSRIIEAFQLDKRGGTLSNIRYWTQQVGGVTQSYPYKGQSAGEIDNYIEFNGGVPTSGDLQTVKSEVESKLIYDSICNFLPIQMKQVKIVIAELSVTDPDRIKNQIEEAVAQLISRLEPWVEGVSVAPRNDLLTTANLTSAVETVVFANRGIFNRVTFTVDDDNFSSYRLTLGTKLALQDVYYDGTIT